MWALSLLSRDGERSHVCIAGNEYAERDDLISHSSNFRRDRHTMQVRTDLSVSFRSRSAMENGVENEATLGVSCLLDLVEDCS